MSELQFPLTRDTSRQIIHIDMDAFYASIEIRDHPEWRGKPVVIAKHPKENYGHGVVATASYEARKYGIHSAMSASEAYKRCPHAIFCPGNKPYYKQVSRQVHEIFKRYTEIIEPVALDEAYLDVTQHEKSPRQIAYEIQGMIYQELGLTCSAGVSYNKFLAKIASDYQKPSGLTVILPSQAQVFLKQLSIDKFKGIGKKTLPIMKEKGIETGEDLLKLSEMDLIQEFGKRGYDLYRKVRGIDDSPVKAHRERKSIGREHTHHPVILDEQTLKKVIFEECISVSEQLKEKHLKAYAVVFKWRYKDFEAGSRQLQTNIGIQEADDIYEYILKIWEEMDDFKSGFRLIGVTATQLQDDRIEQLVLF